MGKKSDSLRYGVSRASLSGPKSKQHRTRQNAVFFATQIRKAGMGVQKWENLSNKHFQRVANAMKENGVSAGRIAEVFSAARHLCRAYGNDRISARNDCFGVQRGAIANQVSRAVPPEVVQKVIAALEEDTTYVHARRAAAQIRLQYELGLRREEAAKLDLVHGWDRVHHTLDVRHGTKGGRPRVLTLSPPQEAALEKALPFISRSNRPGVFNLMPEGMGDEWQNRLSYVARSTGLTKAEHGFTLHGNRHEHFRQMYRAQTGFEPPNRHPSLAAFQEAARAVAGAAWEKRDAEARDVIEVTAGHSPGRRDVSDAYLGSSCDK